MLQCQTVQIELLVIDRGIVGDRLATSIVATIADDNLDRLDGDRCFLIANFGSKGSGLSNQLDGFEGIGHSISTLKPMK